MDKNLLFEASVLARFFPRRLLGLDPENQGGQPEMPCLRGRAPGAFEEAAQG